MRKPFQIISPFPHGQISASGVRGADREVRATAGEPRCIPGTAWPRPPHADCSIIEAEARQRCCPSPSSSSSLALGGRRRDRLPGRARSGGRPRRRRGGRPGRRLPLARPARLPGDPGRPREAPRPGGPRGRVDPGAPPARRRRVDARSTVDAARAAMERVLALDPGRPARPRAVLPRLPARVRGGARARRVPSPLPAAGDDPDGSGEGWVQGRPSARCRWRSCSRPAATAWASRRGGTVRTITLELSRDERVVVDVTAPVALRRPTSPRARRPHRSRSSRPPGAWMRPAAWTATGLAVAAAGLATWQGIAAAGS